MKRKVNNPNPQEKKLNHIKEKIQEKDLKELLTKEEELEREMKLKGPTK